MIIINPRLLSFITDLWRNIKLVINLTNQQLHNRLNSNQSNEMKQQMYVLTRMHEPERRRQGEKERVISYLRLISSFNFFPTALEQYTLFSTW